MAAKLTDDILKWTLDIDGKPAMKALSDWEQKTRSVEKANKALETEMAKLKARGKENTDEYRALEKQMKTNNATIRQAKARMAELRQEVGVTGMTMVQLRQRSKELKAQLDRTVPKTAEWKKLRAELDATEKRMGQIGTSSKKTGGMMGGLGKMIPFAGWAAAGAAAIGALVGVFKNAMRVREEFSRYEAVLKNTLGSQKAANAAFADLKEFAATTPFQLNELTDGYVKLTNMGFQPTMDEMTKMGDLAAAMGKPFDQLAEAVIDAQTGENERLKEFGIRAQKEGDKIKYTFKGVTTEVDNNAEAIRGYLLTLGDMDGVKGGMAEISKTIGGAISNNKDAIDNLWNTIGTKLEPIVVKVLTWYTEIIQKFSEWIEGSGEGFDKLYNWFAELYNQSLPIRIMVQAIVLNFKLLFNSLALPIKAFIAQITGGAKVLKAVFTGDFKAIPGLIKETLDKGKKIAVDQAKKTGQDFTKAWDNSINGKLEYKIPKPDTTDSDDAIANEEKKRQLAEDKKKEDAKKAAEKAQKANEEAAKKALDTSKKAQKKEILELRKSMFEKGATRDEMNGVIQLKELEHLSTLLAIQKKYGQDTTSIESSILDKQIKAREDYQKNIEGINKAIADASKDFKLDDEKFETDDEGYQEGIKALDRYQELKQNYQSKEKTDREALNTELADLDEALRLGGILSHEEYEKKKAEITAKYAGERFKKEQEYLQGASAVLNALTSSFEAAKQLELKAAGDNAALKEKIEKKYAKKQQKISIGQALINGAMAQLKILAEVPKADFGVMTAILMTAAAAATAAEIATISNQQFKTGGFTAPADSDSRPAGIVHANEWVASAPLLRNPETRRHIDYLENVQRGIYPRFNTASISAATRGFQIGGHTSTPPPISRTDAMPGVSVAQEQNTAMMGAMIGLLNELKQNGVKSQINTQEVFSKQQQYENNLRASKL